MMTDPIADMLTRIRNGVSARLTKVDIPSSKLKIELARILKEEGYIQNYKDIEDDKHGTLRVFLRRIADGSEVVQGLKRVSRPGCRIYVPKDKMPVLASERLKIVVASGGNAKTGKFTAVIG